MTLFKPHPAPAVWPGRVPEQACPASTTPALDPSTHKVPPPRAPRRELRLADHAVIVPRDVGVRIPPTTRALLDRFCTQYHLDEAEVARVLLASGLLAGSALRDRVAAALLVNGAMHTHAEANGIVAALREELAQLSAVVARTASPISARADRVERGPGDPSLLRMKLHDLLRRILRDLVDVYTAVRLDGEIPEAADEASFRLIRHLLSRKTAEIRRERSPVAEVVRWTLAQAETDADQLLGAYVRCRAVMWKRIDRTVAAMRAGARKELGAALSDIR